MHRFHKMYAVALVLVVLAASVAAHAARGIDEGGVSLTCLKPVAASYTQIKFVCTTNVPTTLSIATGATSNQNDAVPTPDRLKTHHVVYVPGLSPNTFYYAWVTATAKNGQKSKPLKYGIPTWAPGTAPATVTSKGNKLLLNGQPFFAFVHALVSCPDSQLAKDATSLKANVVTSNGLSCPSASLTPTERAQQLHSVLSNHLWFWDPQASDAQALQGLLSELLNNSTGGLRVWHQPVIENVCATTTNLYSAILKAASNSAVLYYINISTSPHRSGEVWCLNAQSLNMAFWTMVAAHGKGIEYNTADVGDSALFDVKGELVAQAAKQTTQFATVSPVVLTGKIITPTTNSASVIKFSVWQYGGKYYVLAVNTTNKAVTSNFTLSALKNGGTAQVMFEGKSLQIKPGAIPVTLAPFGAKWYKISPK